MKIWFVNQVQPLHVVSIRAKVKFQQRLENVVLGLSTSNGAFINKLLNRKMYNSVIYKYFELNCFNAKV